MNKLVFVNAKDVIEGLRVLCRGIGILSVNKLQRLEL
jgi:hypothetical protein